MFCKDCGTEVHEGIKFCPKCGSPIVLPSVSGEGPQTAFNNPIQQTGAGFSNNQNAYKPAASATTTYSKQFNSNAAGNAQHQPNPGNSPSADSTHKEHKIIGSMEVTGVVDARYTPISMWGYFLYNLLFAVPLVGFIFLLIYAFGGTSNINVQNYARSQFCWLIILLVLGLAIGLPIAMALL